MIIYLIETKKSTSLFLKLYPRPFPKDSHVLKSTEDEKTCRSLRPKYWSNVSKGYGSKSARMAQGSCYCFLGQTDTQKDSQTNKWMHWSILKNACHHFMAAAYWNADIFILVIVRVCNKSKYVVGNTTDKQSKWLYNVRLSHSSVSRDRRPYSCILHYLANVSVSYLTETGLKVH